MTQPVEELSSGDDHANAPYDQLARLYVAGIPKSMNEAQIKPLFDQWGAVRDVMILRERSTGLSRGCAFVGYETTDEAQAAIQHLDHRVHLPSALGPLEVRFARGRHPSPGAADDVRHVVFSGASPGASESELQLLFARSGVVESLSLTRDPETGESKGCGVAAMGSHQDALAAVEALSGKVTLEGAAGPLTARLADPDPRARKDAEDDVDDRTVFFARVLRSATEDSVRALFSRFGRVVEVNLFRAFQGAPTTKGCGLATMGSVEEATAAIAALHEQHTWQGMAQPMVVRWMDSALQRRRREDHLSGRQAPAVTVPISGAFLTSFSAPSNLVGARGALPDARGPAAGAPVGLLAPHAHAHAHAHAAAPHPHPHALPLPHLSDASLYAPMPTEVPPPGCAPDAYKLFIGNVPSCYTERDLRPLFESIGPVVELVVLYDKQTGSSKGSAFCWYTTRADADRAAQHFNERHLLPDPTGHQQRPLVVRPATVRRSVPRALLGAGMAGAVAAGGGGALGGAGLHPQYGLQQPQQQQQRGAAAAAAPPGGIGRLMHPIMLGPGGSADSGVFNSGSFLVDSSAAFASAGHDGDLSALASGGYALGPGSGADSGGYAPLSSGAAPGGGGGAGAAGPGSAGNSTGAAGAGAWDAGGVGALGQLQYVPMGSQDGLPPLGRAPGDGVGVGVGGAGDLLTVQVPVLASQLQAVTPHVFGIQSASGAEVTSQAVAPGVFCLRLSGSKFAVDTASQLISSVIQSAA